MKIVRIDVYQPTYTLIGRPYAWSNEHSVTEFVTTIVKVCTDDGIEGWGEVCPLGPAYMGAYSKGVPPGIAELGPHLIGMDPTRLNAINETMDIAMSGHGYAKSPIDIACWDILGKASGQSVAALMGGRYVEQYRPYRAISMGSPEQMAEDCLKYRSEGYRKFQLKVGGSHFTDIERIKACRAALQPDDLLVADANTGWTSQEAIRVSNAVKHLDVFMEQPCLTYEECLRVRRNTVLPFIIDEVIIDQAALIRALADGAMDGVNLKISRLGGLTKAKTLRDTCQNMGVTMTLEDSWGGDISCAAIAAFVGSTREEFYFSSTDFNCYNDLRVAGGAPARVGEWAPVPEGPGLGIEVDESLIGAPVLSVF